MISDCDISTNSLWDTDTQRSPIQLIIHLKERGIIKNEFEGFLIFYSSQHQTRLLNDLKPGLNVFVVT